MSQCTTCVMRKARAIPQRRFLGIDSIAEEEILDAVHAHLSKAFE